MKLQKTIINRYKEKNPKQTLKKISEDTGIQLTRVFRILNGSEMKISEYEKFSTAIENKDKDCCFSEMIQLANICALRLHDEQIEEIIDLMERKLHFKELLENLEIKKILANVA